MAPMSRVPRVFALSLPLMAGGSLLAHALSYRLAFPDARTLERDLAATGHGYLDHVAFLLAPAVAVGLVALVLAVLDGARRRPARRVPAWPFALLPPLGFAAQEHLERLFHDGSVPWHAAGERTFVVGLALQLPFALLAWLAARVLLAGARQLGQALARRRNSRPRLAPPLLLPSLSPVRPLSPAPLALGYGERGPPLPARV